MMFRIMLLGNAYRDSLLQHIYIYIYIYIYFFWQGGRVVGGGGGGSGSGATNHCWCSNSSIFWMMIFQGGSPHHNILGTFLYIVCSPWVKQNFVLTETTNTVSHTIHRTTYKKKLNFKNIQNFKKWQSSAKGRS